MTTHRRSNGMGISVSYEGAVAVFVACLLVRMLITLTGGNVVFLNEATIDETYLFRLFYHLDFLNFVK